MPYIIEFANSDAGRDRKWGMERWNVGIMEGWAQTNTKCSVPTPTIPGFHPSNIPYPVLPGPHPNPPIPKFLNPKIRKETRANFLTS
jgi:hypothetical protein